ncbi:MAG: hypothetical protein LBF80_00710, partial [Spirochaetaceae bacterium]|nr:hypothetical protein [Spirochaetaceae bacterium]
MLSEKKPSFFSDRGAIGSAEDLDEYGVWVKSEPEDLSFDDVAFLRKTGNTSFEDTSFEDTTEVGYAAPLDVDVAEAVADE